MAAMFGKKRDSDLSLNSLIDVNKGLKMNKRMSQISDNKIEIPSKFAASNNKAL